MAVTYCIKLFCTEADRRNYILMSLLLLASETKMLCQKARGFLGKLFSFCTRSLQHKKGLFPKRATELLKLLLSLLSHLVKSLTIWKRRQSAKEL